LFYKIKNLVEKLRLSNDETYLLKALEKYVPRVSEFKNNKDLIEYFKREFCRSKSNVDRSLRKIEAIEILKYCDKFELIEKIENIKLPIFSINSNSILNHRFYDNESKKIVSVNDMFAKKKLRINKILFNLKEEWIDSNFTITDENLLQKVDNFFLENYVVIKKK
jgi:hypothetical protein